MSGDVELTAAARFHVERRAEDFDAAIELEGLDETLAQEEQALFFALGREAIRLRLCQVAGSDKVLRSPLLGDDVGVSVVGFDNAQYEERRAELVTRKCSAGEHVAN